MEEGIPNQTLISSLIQIYIWRIELIKLREFLTAVSLMPSS